MDVEMLEEIVNNNPDHPVLLLYFLLKEDYDTLKTIYNYKIYGRLLNNLLISCDYDPELLTYAAKVIETRPFITKEIVHDNLSKRKAIKFVTEPFSDKYGIEEIYIHEQGNQFIEKHEQYKQNKKSR